MTWCVLVFVCGDLNLDRLEKETLERSWWETLTSCDTPGSLPAGLTDDKPTEWSSRVTFFVGLKNSCRMKKGEQMGPSRSPAGPQGLP